MNSDYDQNQQSLLFFVISGPNMAHPDSRSDPIGGSEPGLGRETIYWESLPVSFYNRIKISDTTYTKELPPEWCPSKSIHIY